MEVKEIKKGYVAVGKTKTEESANTLFKIPDNSNAIGVIEYAHPESDFTVGQKVVFLNKHTQIHILGKALLIMEEDNVVMKLG